MSLMRSHITSLGYRNWCFGSVHSHAKPYLFIPSWLSVRLKNALRAIKLNSVLKMFALGRTKCQNCF